MTTLAQIKIEELSCDIIIGIHNYERKNAQNIKINILLSYDCEKAAKSDDINDALDYHEISNEVLKHCKNSTYYLIETLASRLFNYLSELKGVKSVSLELFKPEAVKEAKSISIRLKSPE